MIYNIFLILVYICIYIYIYIYDLLCMFLSCSKVIQFVIYVVSFYSRNRGNVFLYNDMCIIRHFYIPAPPPPPRFVVVV